MQVQRNQHNLPGRLNKTVSCRMQALEDQVRLLDWKSRVSDTVGVTRTFNPANGSVMFAFSREDDTKGTAATMRRLEVLHLELSKIVVPDSLPDLQKQLKALKQEVKAGRSRYQELFGQGIASLLQAEEKQSSQIENLYDHFRATKKRIQATYAGPTCCDTEHGQFMVPPSVNVSPATLEGLKRELEKIKAALKKLGPATAGSPDIERRRVEIM